jgi:hypothetical protein
MTWSLVGGFIFGAIVGLVGYWQGRRYERKRWMTQLKVTYLGVIKRDVQ